MNDKYYMLKYRLMGILGCLADLLIQVYLTVEAGFKKKGKPIKPEWDITDNIYQD